MGCAVYNIYHSLEIRKFSISTILSNLQSLSKIYSLSPKCSSDSPFKESDQDLKQYHGLLLLFCASRAFFFFTLASLPFWAWPLWKSTGFSFGGTALHFGLSDVYFLSAEDTHFGQECHRNAAGSF